MVWLATAKKCERSCQFDGPLEEPQVGLTDQSRGLQRAAKAFGAHVFACHLAHFVVYERHETAFALSVALPSAAQQKRKVGGVRLGICSLGHTAVAAQFTPSGKSSPDKGRGGNICWGRGSNTGDALISGTAEPAAIWCHMSQNISRIRMASTNSARPQRDRRIDSRSPPGRQIAGSHGHQGKYHGHAHKRQPIARRHAEE